MLRRARLSSWLCRRSPRSQVQEKRTKYSTVATTKRTTLLDLRKKYTEKKPLVLVTGYSSSDTSLIERSDCVDAILVGDSVAMVSLGHRDTTPVTMEEMIHHCKAATSTTRKLFVIGDMPFGSYEASDEQAVRNAVRLVKEGRVDAVKLEGGQRMAQRVEAIVNAGMPVMGHIGLTPQSQSALGGFRVQGRTTEEAMKLVEDAKALEKAGCFAIVIEAVPDYVAEAITNVVSVPTIGIGAGAKTSGQILVFHDMFGLYSEHTPKFAKQFANVGATIVSGLQQYAAEVTSRQFPAEEHTYKSKSETKAEPKKDTAASSLPQNSAPSIVVPRQQVAIVGAGALGSFFASQLASLSTIDVWMVSEWKEHVDAVNNAGLEVRTPQGTKVVKNIRATSNPRDVARYAAVQNNSLGIVTTKSYQTETAAERVKEASLRYALTLQNGLGNYEKLVAKVGIFNTLQGITGVGAAMIGPGCVQGSAAGDTTILFHQESDFAPETWATHTSEDLKLLRRAASEATSLLLNAGLSTKLDADAKKAIWTKLIANAVINPLTAMLGVTNGELLQEMRTNPKFNNFVSRLIFESDEIAESAGVTLLLLDYHEAVEAILANTAQNQSSMLQDVLRGTPTELDAITGALLKQVKVPNCKKKFYGGNQGIYNIMIQPSFRPGRHNLEPLFKLGF